VLNKRDTPVVGMYADARHPLRESADSGLRLR
jgi:hypothetical protein